jgi:hypothetical protein
LDPAPSTASASEKPEPIPFALRTAAKYSSMRAAMFGLGRETVLFIQMKITAADSGSNEATATASEKARIYTLTNASRSCPLYVFK